MKRKSGFMHLLLGALTLWTTSVAGQTTILGNGGSAGAYLGWNAVANQTLEVRNDANQPINWFTDAIQRLMLYPTNNATLNTFNVPRNGFVGISPQPLFYNNPGPFTRLHLVDSVDNNPTTYAQDFGFRPWMRNGVTMTGNSDQMYIGPKYTYVDSMDYQSGEINDRSDAVIEWSDNPDDAPWGTDRLRFMFTNDYQVAAPETYGARSLEGMEAMRIYIPTDTTAHVGIGDFFRAGVINGQNEDPTERLHVRDGRVRIQQLPDDAPPDSDYVVMVVDTTATDERGVVKWVPASSIVSVADCEWSMTGGSGAGVNDVWTATGGLVNGCPDRTESVGIGTSSPSANAKLHVFTDQFADGAYVRNETPAANAVGLRSEVTAGTTNNAGIVTQVTGPGTSNVGVFTVANGSTGSNTGVSAIAGGGGTTGIALNATASGSSTSNTGLNANVSGAANTNTGGRFTVSGGTAANFGADLTLTGASSANTGVRSTVSGSSASNTGLATTVTGAATSNTGLYVSTADGTTANDGVRIRTNTTGGAVVNSGITIQTVTGNTTSENRGIDIDMTGAADRAWGLHVANSCTNSGSANMTKNGGFFESLGTSFLYSNGVVGDSRGAPATGGVSRGVTGRALGAAERNTGVCGTYNTLQPLDHPGGYGVFGHNRPGTSGYDIGTAGYVESDGVIFPPIKGRTGVAGVVRPGEDMSNIGTLGYVGNGAPTSLVATIGVYGEARDWAGWFTGDTWTQGIGFFTAGMFTISDQSLKENVAELTTDEVASVVSQLHPVSYDFTSEAKENLDLPEGQQFGLLAQELEQVLPGLVKETTHPAVRDSMGNTLQEAMSLKTVNYAGLIPYLIADNQRLQDRLDQIEAALNACCASGADQRAAGNSANSTTALETDLRIIPNPVADQTELRYTVGTEGRVRLEITDASGRSIQTQDEGTRSTGTFSFGWNTTLLAPGTYFCTLYVNDEPLVKKAVKLNAR